jgi:hypothetical protein
MREREEAPENKRDGADQKMREMVPTRKQVVKNGADQITSSEKWCRPENK